MKKNKHPKKQHLQLITTKGSTQWVHSPLTSDKSSMLEIDLNNHKIWQLIQKEEQFSQNNNFKRFQSKYGEFNLEY
uniref:Ribosomal protein L31 n=1 Tax=Ancoracysta twista TaxID=2044563 RepID=A0A2H4R8V4_9EUKA|nr:ribosomal protein L31 [Ancoracysta twista]ATY40938.1 ribosomal protein L31 [Ancoracysta twista]